MPRQTDSIEKLTEIGKQVISSIQNAEYPSIVLPDRSTRNIVFDSVSGQFVLGNSKTKRDSSNVKHVKSFMQLMWVASFAKQLVKNGRTSSLRDIYYSSEAFGVDFKNQAESDRIIADLECLTGISREDFGVFPEEHSSIYGEVVMKYTVSGYEGREVDLTISPDGFPIGSALITAEPVSTKAKMILAIESGGMFSRLIETRCWERFGAVLIHLGGQAPRSTRRLMRKLREHLDLPVFVFTDGDPWGMHIAQVIIAGSANAAHIDRLAIPDAKWIGVTAGDIAKYSLPTEDMNNKDLRRLEELAQDSRYLTSDWSAQIDAFKNLRKKAEQQAFSRHGMDFVVEQYLPDKLNFAI
ncbi:MAG: DNA topoisomerase IV subunit A [Candidatus Thorarchaeota archaeon]|nr:DNA topoisomerase IV subunit A [Candidatus Thorarchaeota archaeon]